MGRRLVHDGNHWKSEVAIFFIFFHCWCAVSKHIKRVSWIIKFREEGQDCIRIYCQDIWARVGRVARTSAIGTKEGFLFANVFCRPTVLAALEHIQPPSILERELWCVSHGAGRHGQSFAKPWPQPKAGWTTSLTGWRIASLRLLKSDCMLEANRRTGFVLGDPEKQFVTILTFHFKAQPGSNCLVK